MEGVEDIPAEVAEPMVKVHANETLGAQMEVWKSDGDVLESLDDAGAAGLNAFR